MRLTTLRKILNSGQNPLVLFSLIVVLLLGSCQITKESTPEKREGHESSQSTAGRQLTESSDLDLHSITPTVIPTPQPETEEWLDMFIEAPEFELVDTKGSKVSLSNTLLENEMAILIFYRGHF